jgi:gluconate:H+ symporter, GntP family
MWPLVLILSCIVGAVVLIARFKINTFLVLLGMSIVLGLSAGFGPDDAIKTIKAGFGHTLEKIGLLIIFGVILGEILDRTQATRSIAHFILSKLGQNRTDLAMLSIGFLVGLPIFCDSGFIILSGLLFYLRSKNNFLTLTLCLAGGLYSVHCLVPPHPGITAAAGQLSLDIGKTMIYGIVFAVPATVVAFFWSIWAGNRFGAPFEPTIHATQPTHQSAVLPAVWESFLPIWLPIALMALKALWPFLATNASALVSFVGEPVVALMIGIGAALPLLLTEKVKQINDICEAAFARSGHILAIVAAGGMFGEVVKKIMTDNPNATHTLLNHTSLGLFLPFLLTVLFKTAQGSSTVAVMSVAAIMQPLLASIGFDTDTEKYLALMAMGAGSMAISHTNDAFFWVVTRFSTLPINLSLKTYTPLSWLMSLTTIIVIWLYSLF